MGKNTILTNEQQKILDLIAGNNYLRSKFYFTGGTALSEVYLRHRLSEDLDIFSQEKFDEEEIFKILEGWSSDFKFKINPVSRGNVNIYLLEFTRKKNLKIDFSFISEEHTS